MKKIFWGIILVFFAVSCVSMSDAYIMRGGSVKIDTKAAVKKSEKDSNTKKVYDISDERGENNLRGADKGIIMRIMILKVKEGVEISSDTPIKISDGCVKDSLKLYVKYDKGININGNNCVSGKVELSSNSIIAVGKKKYRGKIILHDDNDNVLVVNSLPLEEYLYGVLPSEISPAWPMETLKAQAVAARTFALYYRLKSKDKRYDLDNTVNSQVYNGMNIESKFTNEAVNATAGVVITYEGNIVEAFFHANSGGRTADSSEVWGGKLGYLKSVPDEYCSKGNHYRWETRLTADKMREILEKCGIQVGIPISFSVESRTPSGRVDIMKVDGDKGSAKLKAKDFRNKGGVDIIRSTNFDIINDTDGGFTIKGMGWGHGVGLSQDGARGMAEAGYTYRAILSHFYNGVTIKKAVLE